MTDFMLCCSVLLLFGMTNGLSIDNIVVNNNHRHLSEKNYTQKLEEDTCAFVQDVQEFIKKKLGKEEAERLILDYHFNIKNQGLNVKEKPCGDLVLHNMFRIVAQWIRHPKAAVYTVNEARALSWHPSFRCMLKNNLKSIEGGASAGISVTCDGKKLIEASAGGAGTFVTGMWSRPQSYTGEVSMSISLLDKKIYIEGGVFSEWSVGLVNSTIPDDTKDVLKLLDDEISNCARSDKLLITGSGLGGWQETFVEPSSAKEVPTTTKESLGYGFVFSLSSRVKPTTAAPIRSNPNASSTPHPTLASKPTETPPVTARGPEKLPVHEERSSAPKRTSEHHEAPASGQKPAGSEHPEPAQHDAPEKPETAKIPPKLAPKPTETSPVTVRGPEKHPVHEERSSAPKRTSEHNEAPASAQKSAESEHHKPAQPDASKKPEAAKKAQPDAPFNQVVHGARNSHLKEDDVAFKNLTNGVSAEALSSHYLDAVHNCNSKNAATVCVLPEAIRLAAESRHQWASHLNTIFAQLVEHDSQKSAAVGTPIQHITSSSPSWLVLIVGVILVGAGVFAVITASKRRGYVAIRTSEESL